MSGKKEKEKKDFLIASRKKIGSSITAAPVWILQKAQKQLWNKRQKRHWRRTSLGKLFKRKQKEQGKE